MKYSFLSLFLLFSIFAKAQNGKIVEQTSFSLSDYKIDKLADSSLVIKAQLNDKLRRDLAKVNYHHITYMSDGLKVKAYIATPKSNGTYPCVIYNRGGNNEFGKITDEGFLLRGLGEISRAGYVVVGSQYRGNDGGEGQEEFGGEDLNDILNLIPLLANIEQADTSRIGMFGWSRGGMATYQILTKTKKIKAAIVGSGPTDLFKLLERRPVFDTLVFPNMIKGYEANRERELKSRSAYHFADKLNKNTPILIFQGAADWRVPTKPVLRFVDKLIELKHPFRFVLFEGGDHSLLEHRSDYIEQTIKWLNKYVRDGKKWPSTELHGG